MRLKPHRLAGDYIRFQRAISKASRQATATLKYLGAFAVAFDANGSVSSARFRHSIAPGFSEACRKLQVVDLKGAVGIRQSLQVLTRLESLRMIVLSASDVKDEDIQLLTQIPGLKHYLDDEYQIDGSVCGTISLESNALKSSSLTEPRLAPKGSNVLGS